MKRLKTMLMLLTVLLSQICKANSIADTIPTNVTLKPKQAVGVLKDLIRFDGCKEIMKVMEGQIIDLRKMSDQKDTIIKLHEANAVNFRGIIANDETIIRNKDQSYADLNRKYKRSVRVGRFKVVLLVAAVAGGAYLILK